MGVDHVNAALLRGVALNLGLLVPSRPGPNAAHDRSQTERGRQAALHLQRFVGLALWIGEDADIAGVVFLKDAREIGRTVADDDHFSAGRADGGGGFQEVSDLLTAEQSAKVPDENQDDGLLAPKRRDVDRLLLRVEDREFLEWIHRAAPCGCDMIH